MDDYGRRVMFGRFILGKHEYHATVWIIFFIMIILDDNHKVRRLIEGFYENDDVLFWNSNEAEMRPDYDYTTLKQNPSPKSLVT